ncbi:MAG: GntR family transcriptional regulator [Oscillospiraceae bacterium]|nr:GntR family transcriptional regulator [Oscillospiraceae bacterium]
MTILLDNQSGEPIYGQICAQIRDQILSGALSADEPLPSMRNLAKDLRISVITTKRAYEELEREGYIYTVPAKGCFVACLNPALLREEHLRQLEEKLMEAAALARRCALSEDDVREMLHDAMEELV